MIIRESNTVGDSAKTVQKNYVPAALASVTTAAVRLRTGAQSAAKAQTALAAATAAAAKAARAAIGGFDELNLAAQSTQKAARAAAKSGGSGTGTKKSSAEKEPKSETAAPQKAPLPAWLQTLNAQLAPSVAAWQAAFDAIYAAAQAAFASVQKSALALWNDALAPLWRSVTGTFLPAMINAFSGTFAPILAGVAQTALQVFAKGFEAACGIVQNAVNTLVRPALALISKIFTEMCAAVKNTWDTYGAGLLDGFSRVCSSIFSLLQGLYTNAVQPVLASILATVENLWNTCLAPLWQKLTDFLAATGNMLLSLWNEIIAPLLAYLVDVFAPVFAGVGENLGAVLAGVARAAGDMAGAVLDVLRSLMDFLAHVFAGDWSAAWVDIQNVFAGVWKGIVELLRGAVNGIISLENGMLRGIAQAINGVVGALNSLQITIPRWVPVYGGKSFGISLPQMEAPQIPLLARGAVIPPNAAFLAVLGDQRHGRNLEAPETLIRQIVREESGAGGVQRFEAEQPVQLALDGQVLYRAMMKVRAQRGRELGGAFAYAY